MTETELVDIDGDGVPDFVEQAAVTAYEVDRSGTIDADQVSVEAAVAIRADPIDDGDPTP